MASGDTFLSFDKNNDTTVAQAVVTRNIHNVIPLALTEIATFPFKLPTQYQGGGLTVVVECAMESATANDVKVEGSIDRIGIGQVDIDTDSFAAAQDSTDITVPGTAGHVFELTLTFTDGAQIDGLLQDERAVLKIQRVAVVGTDAAGDLQILGVTVKET